MIINKTVMEIFERFHEYGEEWCRTHPEEMKKIRKEVKKIREKQMKEREINNKKEEEVMTLNEQLIHGDIKLYKADQQICDLADIILKVFVKKQISIDLSLKALDRAKKTLELSTRSTNWGEPLIQVSTPNEALTFYAKEVVRAQMKGRK